MANLVELNKILDEKKVSSSLIARYIGKTRQCVTNKLAGRVDFTTEEMNIICRLLLLSDEKKLEIFLIKC